MNYMTPDNCACGATERDPMSINMALGYFGRSHDVYVIWCIHCNAIESAPIEVHSWEPVRGFPAELVRRWNILQQRRMP